MFLHVCDKADVTNNLFSKATFDFIIACLSLRHLSMLSILVPAYCKQNLITYLFTVIIPGLYEVFDLQTSVLITLYQIFRGNREKSETV